MTDFITVPVVVSGVEEVTTTTGEIIEIVVKPSSALKENATVSVVTVEGPQGIPGPSNMIVQSAGAYPARPLPGPCVFVGDINPFTLSLMLDGDTWINTDPIAGVTAPVNGSPLLWNPALGIYDPASLSLWSLLAALAPIVGLDSDGVPFHFTLGTDPLPANLAAIRADEDGIPYFDPIPQVALDSDGVPYIHVPAIGA